MSGCSRGAGGCIRVQLGLDEAENSGIDSRSKAEVELCWSLVQE